MQAIKCIKSIFKLRVGTWKRVQVFYYGISIGNNIGNNAIKMKLKEV